MRLAPIVQSLTEPLLSPLVSAITGASSSGFSPTSLFVSGQQGYVYDLNDLSTLYLDSAGTTAASVNGLVGLQLDKSANLALGAELLGTGATGIIGSATAASYNTGTGAGSVSRVDGSNQSFVTFTGLSSTAFYRVTIQNTGAQILSFRQGTYASTILGDIGVGTTVTFNCLATTGQLTLTMSPTAGTGTFTITAVKLLPGNHRYQTTTGSKPILRGTPVGSNLVTNGDFASGTTGWTGINATLSNVANRLRVTAVANGESSASFAIATTAGGVYRITVDFVTDAVTGSTFLYAGTSTGSANLLNVNLLSTPRTAVAYFTAIGTTSYITLASSSGALAAEYNEWDNVEVKDVSTGQVQAPYGLQYDGIDDFLTTASVDFTATDKMAVCMGVRKLSDVARGMLVEIGAGGGAGSFFLSAPNNSGTANYAYYSQGSVAGTAASATTYTAPITNVLTGLGDIAGDSQILRVNGTQVATSATDQGTGNYLNAALFFGRRNGASLPLNGLDFGGVCIGKTLTATQLASVEKWVSLRTGVTI